MCPKSFVILLSTAISTLVLGPSDARAADPAQYIIRWTESTSLDDVTGAHLAENAVQGFDAWIAPEGLRLRPPDGSWEVGLVLLRVGREGALRKVEPAGVETLGSRAEFVRGSLVEWYMNGEGGLEQGFTFLESPAAEADGPLVIELALGGDLLPLLAGDGQRVDLLRPGSRLPNLVYGSLAVADAEGRELPARMELVPRSGSETSMLRIAVDDDNAIYPVTVDPLVTAAVWTSADSVSTFSVAWGDWDGDGDLDLAAGNYGQPNHVYENTGGALSSVWTSADSDNTKSVAWGDWDGDGDLDLAAGNYAQSNRVYENTGGDLASAWTSADFDDTESIAWGDWDGDGDLDLAAGNWGQSNCVYENTGGDLAAAWTSTDSDHTRLLAWGDWDGDGDLDLATGNWVEPNRLYQNNGGDLTSIWTSPDSDDTRSIAWGDWDGDGDLDLAAGNWRQPNRVYQNNGGDLASAWTSTDSDDTVTVAWGDWDGDGDLDLAAANSGQSSRVYENTGGDLASAWTSADSDLTECVAWGDWDGDGDLDLAAGNYSQPNRVYENIGGPLVSVWTSADSDDTISVAWGDWDSDGDLDLAAGNASHQPNRVYENTGGDLGPAWTSADSDESMGVAWGDWDGDGDLDLAAGSLAANRVYENTGGALASAWTSADSDYTSNVAWGDWDGDGDLDLATGNDRHSSRVYENTGGALASAWTSADSFFNGNAAWGDWDGDGDLDLAVGNETEANRVYENNGGAFTLAWTSADSDRTLIVAWGDWDGDGDLDLAAGNYAQPNRVYENTGGDLASAWTSVDSDNTWSVAWGDWDGDGDLDLVAGNYSQPNRVYENNGGTLASIWTSADSDDTRCVAWGDWDGDGDIDLATANRFQPNRVYENGGLRRPGRLPETPVTPVILWRPGSTDAAFFHSVEECLSSPIIIIYTLVDEETDRARRIVPEYSLNGGSLTGVRWLPATEGPVSDGTEELAASPAGRLHVFVWDAPTDGVLHENQVVFRITVPYQASTRVVGPIQRAAMSAVSPPFRVCDSAANLALTKSDGQDSAVPGETVNYTITVTNLGADDVAGARVSDTFAEELSGVTWTCYDSGGGTCANPSGSGDIDEMVDLPVGTSVTFTTIATVSSSATGLLSNTASAALPVGMTEIDDSNNSATDIDALVPSTDLAITKTDSQTEAVPGEPVTYSLTVSNAGPSTALSAPVADLFPAELSAVTWTCDDSGGGTCANPSGTGDINETVDLPVGTSVTFTATGTVDPAARGALVNTATVLPAGRTGDRGDPNPGDNSATDVDTLTPESDLEITKSDGAVVALPGEQVTYAIVVTNNGPSSVTGAVVTDAFPAELTGVTWTCAEGGGTCATPSGSGDVNETVDLPVGTSVTFTATGTVDPGATGMLDNTATVVVPSGVNDPVTTNNSATDSDTLRPGSIFADGFESGDTTAWSEAIPKAGRSR